MFGCLKSDTRKAALLFAVAMLLPAASAVGQDDALDKGIVRERAELAAGKRMAILVGAQDYDALPKLRFCHADVKLLEKTLKEDCKFDRVITMTEDAAEKRYRPTRSSLIRELGVWLDLANKSEYSQVLVYFSGHGYRGADEQLYFAPPDCDPNNLEETCLPQAYVRKKLDACDRVKVKLLILDTCHAGETKAASEGVASEELAAVFKNAKGLYTMASCRSEEVSLEWPAKRQGLFTYWLAEGLKGAADRDGDKLVDTSELYKFTYNQVLETSTELGRVQNVVERPSDDWQGIAVLARVRIATDRTDDTRVDAAKPIETNISNADDQIDDNPWPNFADIDGFGIPDRVEWQPISISFDDSVPEHAKLFIRIGNHTSEFTPQSKDRSVYLKAGEGIAFYSGGNAGWRTPVAMPAGGAPGSTVFLHFSLGRDDAGKAIWEARCKDLVEVFQEN